MAQYLPTQPYFLFHIGEDIRFQNLILRRVTFYTSWALFGPVETVVSFLLSHSPTPFAVLCVDVTHCSTPCTPSTLSSNPCLQPFLLLHPSPPARVSDEHPSRPSLPVPCSPLSQFFISMSWPFKFPHQLAVSPFASFLIREVPQDSAHSWAKQFLSWWHFLSQH